MNFFKDTKDYADELLVAKGGDIEAAQEALFLAAPMHKPTPNAFWRAVFLDLEALK
jgi:hypothetical protein